MENQSELRIEEEQTRVTKRKEERTSSTHIYGDIEQDCTATRRKRFGNQFDTIAFQGKKRTRIKSNRIGRDSHTKNNNQVCSRFTATV